MWGMFGRGFGRGWGRGGFFPQTPPGTLPPLPPPQNALRIATGTEDNRGLDAPIAFHFARAPFLTVVDVSDYKVVKVYVKENVMASGLHGVGMAVGQWLISSGVRVVLAPRLGPNIQMILQQAGVKIHYVTPGIRVLDALRSLGYVK